MSENSIVAGVLAGLFQRMPSAKERRRHALLQAAALITSGSVDITDHSVELLNEVTAVGAAERLLAEIEKREKETEEAQS